MRLRVTISNAKPRMVPAYVSTFRDLLSSSQLKTYGPQFYKVFLGMTWKSGTTIVGCSSSRARLGAKFRRGGQVKVMRTTSVDPLLITDYRCIRSRTHREPLMWDESWHGYFRICVIEYQTSLVRVRRQGS